MALALVSLQELPPAGMIAPKVGADFIELSCIHSDPYVHSLVSAHHDLVLLRAHCQCCNVIIIFVSVSCHCKQAASTFLTKHFSHASRRLHTSSHYLISPSLIWPSCSLSDALGVHSDVFLVHQSFCILATVLPTGLSLGLLSCSSSSCCLIEGSRIQEQFSSGLSFLSNSPYFY